MGQAFTQCQQLIKIGERWRVYSLCQFVCGARTVGTGIKDNLKPAGMMGVQFGDTSLDTTKRCSMRRQYQDIVRQFGKTVKGEQPGTEWFVFRVEDTDRNITGDLREELIAGYQE